MDQSECELNDNVCQLNTEEVNYEVEKVICKILWDDGIPKYSIKWKNYSLKENSWMSKEELDNCHSLLEEFDRVYKHRYFIAEQVVGIDVIQDEIHLFVKVEYSNLNNAEIESIITNFTLYFFYSLENL